MCFCFLLLYSVQPGSSELIIPPLSFMAFNELAGGFKAKGRPRKRYREDIKDTLQQQRLTMFDVRRQSSLRLIKATLRPESTELTPGRQTPGS
jgi:hypothetical protein